ncbi:MAG: glycosyltransferase family 2 protein [Pseudomonadota bacterium]
MKIVRNSPHFNGALDAQTGTRPKIDLSVVIPTHNEEDNVERAIKSVHQEVSRLVTRHEIILVDDGSTDDTLSTAKALIAHYPLRVVRLSRNFGKEQAIMAGLTSSHGSAVVICDADLQEPLHYLEGMLAAHHDGYEMVYTRRDNRADETFLKRLLTRSFYTMLNVGVETRIPPDARDFRLMDRRVVDALCSLPERNRFMKGLYGWVGFRSKEILIRLEPRRHGQSKFGTKRLWRLGLTAMTSFTSWPLRVWTVAGLLFAIVSILYGAWIAVRTMVFGIDVPGWTTLAASIFLLGGVQLFSIGVLGEYLSRVFAEVKGRPGFIVAEEFGSCAQDLE